MYVNARAGYAVLNGTFEITYSHATSPKKYINKANRSQGSVNNLIRPKKVKSISPCFIMAYLRQICPIAEMIDAANAINIGMGICITLPILTYSLFHSHECCS